MKLLFSFLLCCLGVSSVFGKTTQRLSSPDGTMYFSVEMISGRPFYSISYRDKEVVAPSLLGFDFDNGRFQENLLMGKVKRRKGVESYDLVVGKCSHVEAPFREMRIPLIEQGTPKRRIDLVVRAFDEGVAFRYEIPSQQGWDQYEMRDELTQFNLSGNPKGLVLFLPSYTSSHEGPYSHLFYRDIPVDTLMDMPALFEYDSDCFVAITEARVVDYAGMYLSRSEEGMKGRLSPYPDKENIKVIASLPHQTPWRVFLIGNRPGALIESNLLTHLNDPCKIEDPSWIVPGTATFPWWNGTVVPDTTFAPGNNFETNKYYIDFCARNGILYHSVVEYGQHEWYVNDGGDFMPGAQADASQTISTIDMDAICKYAESKGVKIRLWTHWKALYPVLDKAFAQYEAWGITGLMVDFMDRDDQEMIRIQEEILQKAAQHKLHIQFHGSCKPNGLHRTYPNEFTREGTLNHEVYKWDTNRLMGADHDIAMPFTRMLAGATDYHLGGFRAVPDSAYRIQYRNPLVTSTRGHMLGLYVVLESYLGMACDHPMAYEGAPGFDFICQVPTVWDETVVPQSRINEYLVVARRKGTGWFVGAITDRQARTLWLDLNFLSPNKQYEVTLYKDHPDTMTDPNLLKIEQKRVSNKERLELPLASCGGCAIVFKEISL